MLQLFSANTSLSSDQQKSYKKCITFSSWIGHPKTLDQPRWLQNYLGPCDRLTSRLVR